MVNRNYPLLINTLETAANRGNNNPEGVPILGGNGGGNDEEINMQQMGPVGGDGNQNQGDGSDEARLNIDQGKLYKAEVFDVRMVK